MHAARDHVGCASTARRPARPVSYGGRDFTAPFIRDHRHRLPDHLPPPRRFTVGRPHVPLRPLVRRRPRANVRNLTVPDERRRPARPLRGGQGGGQAGHRLVASRTATPPSRRQGRGRRRGTRWSSNRADNQYWQVDLGRRRTSTASRSTWEDAYASRYQDPDLAGRHHLEHCGRRDHPAARAADHAVRARVARYVRVLGLQRATQYGISFYEARVLGPPTTPPRPRPRSAPAPGSN